MNNLNSIAYNILELYNAGRLSDDYRPSLRQIKYIILYWRATLIRRDIQKNGFISNAYWQDLGCVPLTLVDSAECCSVSTGCKVLRTAELPVPVRLNDKDAIRVFLVDKTTALSNILPESIPYLSGNKYPVKPSWYLRSNKVYVHATDDFFRAMKFINIQGIFEDPTEVARFETCDDEACYTDNSPFPIPMDMVSQLTQAILTGELKISKETPEDMTNNGLPV